MYKRIWEEELGIKIIAKELLERDILRREPTKGKFLGKNTKTL